MDQPPIVVPQPGGEQSTDAVRSRLHAYAQAWVNDDINTMMEFYSGNFHSIDGELKSDVRNSLNAGAAVADIIGITFIHETYGLGDSGSVVSAFTWNITLRSKQTGEIATGQLVSGFGWINENGTWRIITASTGTISPVEFKKFVPKSL